MAAPIIRNAPPPQMLRRRSARAALLAAALLAPLVWSAPAEAQGPVRTHYIYTPGVANSTVTIPVDSNGRGTVTVLFEARVPGAGRYTAGFEAEDYSGPTSFTNSNPAWSFLPGPTSMTGRCLGASPQWNRFGKPVGTRFTPIPIEGARWRYDGTTVEMDFLHTANGADVGTAGPGTICLWVTLSAPNAYTAVDLADNGGFDFEMRMSGTLDSPLRYTDVDGLKKDTVERWVPKVVRVVVEPPAEEPPLLLVTQDGASVTSVTAAGPVGLRLGAYRLDRFFTPGAVLHNGQRWVPVSASTGWHVPIERAEVVDGGDVTILVSGGGSERPKARQGNNHFLAKKVLGSATYTGPPHNWKNAQGYNKWTGRSEPVWFDIPRGACCLDITVEAPPGDTAAITIGHQWDGSDAWAYPGGARTFTFTVTGPSVGDSPVPDQQPDTDGLEAVQQSDQQQESEQQDQQQEQGSDNQEDQQQEQGSDNQEDQQQDQQQQDQQDQQQSQPDSQQQPDAVSLEERIQEQIDRAAANGLSWTYDIWRRALAAVRGEDPPAGLEALTAPHAQLLADNHARKGNAYLAALWQEVADTFNNN